MLTKDGVDELFLPTLRILYLQRKDLCSLVVHSELGEVEDSVLLVVFDSDDGTAYTEGTLEDLYADEDLFALAEHEGVVAGEVRFALYSVDDQDLGLSSWGRGELDVGGEGRSSEPHDTGGGDALDDLLGL